MVTKQTDTNPDKYLGTVEHAGPHRDDHQEESLGLEGRRHRDPEQEVGEDGARHAGQDDADQGGQGTVPDHDEVFRMNITALNIHQANS